MALGSTNADRLRDVARNVDRAAERTVVSTVPCDVIDEQAVERATGGE